MGFSRRTGGRRRNGGRRRIGGMGVLSQAAVPVGLMYVQKRMQHNRGSKSRKSRKSRGGGVSGMITKFKNALGGGSTRRGGRRRGGSRRR